MIKKNNADIVEKISGTTPTQICDALDAHTDKTEKYGSYPIILSLHHPPPPPPHHFLQDKHLRY